MSVSHDMHPQHEREPSIEYKSKLWWGYSFKVWKLVYQRLVNEFSWPYWWNLHAKAKQAVYPTASILACMQ